MKNSSGSFFRDVLWQIAQPGVMVASGISLLVFSLASNYFIYDLVVPNSTLAFPAGLYDLLLSSSPLGLVLPLVMAVPFTLPWVAWIRNRFATYARLRIGARRMLAASYFGNAIVSFLVFFLIGFIPYFWVAFGDVTYHPESWHLLTSEDIKEAEETYSTFSQFSAWGSWGYPLMYSLWLAMNAVLYSAVSLSLVILVRNKALAISLPWISYLIAIYTFAVLWLEAYSPTLVWPFNLTQQPLWHLLVPLTMMVLIAGTLVTTVLVRAPKLSQLQ
ncbi:MAG: hypothetical protein LBM23_04545 [Propionibacteriaceae bacterium]|nr:hypothetical protein [Propionibacteriaceae bacterium]